MKTILFAMILLFTVTDAVHAQFPGGGFPGGSRGGRPGIERSSVRPGSDGMDRRARPEESLSDLVEYRLNILQEDLKLTAEQERTWMTFSDRVREMAADVIREQSRPPVAGATALQQANQAVDGARNRLTAMEDIASSMKKFYESLTPPQRTLTDQRVATLLPLLQGRNQTMRPDASPVNRPGGVAP